MALYRVSGNLYTVSFESNLGDVMVRTLRLPSLSSGYSHGDKQKRWSVCSTSTVFGAILVRKGLIPDLLSWGFRLLPLCGP